MILNVDIDFLNGTKKGFDDSITAVPLASFVDSRFL